MIYADTSLLVSLYISEEQTEVVRKYVEKVETGLAFTPFHRLELRAALRLRVFRREVGGDFLKESFRQMETDLQQGLFQHTVLNWNDALREAEEIAQAHLTEVGARARRDRILHLRSTANGTGKACWPEGQDLALSLLRDSSSCRLR